MVKKKTTPWLKIKAEYLQGATPKELAAKYKLIAICFIMNLFCGKWVNEKERLEEKTRENLKEKIKDLTNLALEALVQVIKDPECENRDKVSASKAILDISGLKSSKQEITGKDGEPLAVKKIFITPEEIKETDKHIENMING